MGLVCAERRRAAKVDERAPSRRQGLGVAEDEAGVVPGGQDVDETGGAGLRRGPQPPVPVAPPEDFSRQRRRAIVSRPWRGRGGLERYGDIVEVVGRNIIGCVCYKYPLGFWRGR